MVSSAPFEKKSCPAPISPLNGEAQKGAATEERFRAPKIPPADPPSRPPAAPEMVSAVLPPTLAIASLPEGATLSERIAHQIAARGRFVPGVSQDRRVELLPPSPPLKAIYVSQPAIPKILVHLTSDEGTEFVAAWTRSAYESRGRRSSHIRATGKNKELFEDVRDLCIEHEIPPGAWVAWQLDRILEKLPTHARTRMVPPLKNVFSMRTMTEFRWQFWADYAGVSRTYLSRAGEKILQRLRCLHALTEPMTTEAEIQRATAEAFPYGWPLTYGAAHQQTQREQQKISQQIRDYAWLWERREHGSEEKTDRTPV